MISWAQYFVSRGLGAPKGKSNKVFPGCGYALVCGKFRALLPPVGQMPKLGPKRRNGRKEEGKISQPLDDIMTCLSLDFTDPSGRGLLISFLLKTEPRFRLNT